MQSREKLQMMFEVCIVIELLWKRAGKTVLPKRPSCPQTALSPFSNSYLSQASLASCSCPPASPQPPSHFPRSLSTSSPQSSASIVIAGTRECPLRRDPLCIIFFLIIQIWLSVRVWWGSSARARYELAKAKTSKQGRAGEVWSWTFNFRVDSTIWWFLFLLDFLAWILQE